MLPHYHWSIIMPAKSQAQLKKLFVLEKQGKLKKGTAEEFARATPDIKKLPVHVKKRKK
jgi:hypothetical protein